MSCGEIWRCLFRFQLPCFVLREVILTIRYWSAKLQKMRLRKHFLWKHESCFLCWLLFGYGMQYNTSAVSIKLSFSSDVLESGRNVDGNRLYRTNYWYFLRPQRQDHTSDLKNSSLLCRDHIWSLNSDDQKTGSWGTHCPTILLGRYQIRNYSNVTHQLRKFSEWRWHCIAYGFSRATVLVTGWSNDSWYAYGRSPAEISSLFNKSVVYAYDWISWRRLHGGLCWISFCSRDRFEERPLFNLEDAIQAACRANEKIHRPQDFGLEVLLFYILER